MVFQTRHPSWIILCYIWLLHFAHTGEAQAAKEGKVMGKQSLFWLIYLAVYLQEPAGPRGCRPRLRRPATLPRRLPAPSPLRPLQAGRWLAGLSEPPAAPRPGPLARPEWDFWRRLSRGREHQRKARGGGRGLGGVGTADELVLPELGQVRSLPLALCFFSSRRSSHWD